MKDEVCVLATTGMLGSGFAEESFLKALEYHPDVIGCDSGSTDSGPYCLGAGVPNKSKKAIKRDLKIMIVNGVKQHIPVLVGSAGTAGAEAHLQWTLDIVREIAEEENLHFKLAAIHAEIGKETLRGYIKKGKMKPLYPEIPFQESDVDDLVRVVGVMGPEPYIEAIKNGADVIIAGRSNDTAIFAAVPVMNGIADGPTWQAAKMLECGAGCAEKRFHPDCMMAWIRKDSCSIEPPNPKFRCTPVSCVSHTLYENADPFRVYEPSGVLDITNATYTAESERRVRVEGCEFKKADKYTIKLEGVVKAGYRQITIGAIRDPIILRQLHKFLDSATESIEHKVSISLNMTPEEYKFQIRTYGEENGETPKEVGIVMECIAKTQEQAAAIMAVAWHTILHHPIPEWSGLQSQVAFPFSPPSVPAGEVYHFALNHVLEVEDPKELFPITYSDL